MATGIPFDHSNSVYTAPGCYDLHTWQGLDVHGNLQVVSCWKFTPEELQYIAEHGHCFLKVMGGQPPVTIFAEDIYRDPTDAEIEDVAAAIPASGFVVMDDNAKARRVMVQMHDSGPTFEVFDLVKQPEGIRWVYGSMTDGKSVFNAYPLRLTDELADSYLNIPFDPNYFNKPQ